MIEQPKVFGYVVEGSRYGGFPLDMLRYSQSYPVDADIIHMLLYAQEKGDYSAFPEKRVRVKVCTVQDPSRFGFLNSERRWESFGWRVVEVTDHRKVEDFGWLPEAAFAEAES